MRALTPSERRGALVVLALLLLGAARDLIIARIAPLAPRPAGEVRVGGPTTRAPDPGPAPVAVARSAPAGGEDGGVEGAPLDLNQASAADLDRLPGIGPVLARRIVEHRQQAGRFRSIDELR